MTENKEKVEIMDAIKNIEEYFIKEGLTAHEILVILRDLENTAIVALVLGANDIRNNATKKKKKGIKDETTIQ